MMAKSDLDTEELAEIAMQWIARLNSGTATKADWQAWHAWRAESPRHEQAAAEAESLWSEISQLHVDRATGLVKPGRKPLNVSRRSVLTGIGAVAVTGAVGGAMWQSGAFTRFFADHATAVATMDLIALPDGSRITLSARSAIDTFFDRQSRRVSLLQGQAFLEVAEGSSLPFEVTIGGVFIRSQGATFDISRNLPDGAMEVAVAANSVEVLASSATSIALNEGEIVSVDGSSRIGHVRHQNVADTGAWRQGVYRADARTLAEVVAALSPWYGGRILIADDDLRALSVDAVLDLRDPRGSLDALQGGLPIHVRHLANLLTVISTA